MKPALIIINRPVVSKINWLALILTLINIAAVAGFIPQAYVIHILSVVNIVGPALIMVARTWFTARS